MLHPLISGNKFRKLKYNIIAAKESGRPILTFGGAYSNHIAATAAAGKLHGVATIGVIRGEELEHGPLNPTLDFARSQGMKLHFINRQTYRDKHLPSVLSLMQQRFGAFFHLPEGGTNEDAVRGCEEILGEADFGFNYICCACGTGGTLAGLSRKADENQRILGFAASRDESVGETIRKYSRKDNWTLLNDFDFGGYGKVNPVLIDFINGFKSEYGVGLDPIYTGKMMFGVMSMLAEGYFEPGARILAVHTGGLQGIAGMNLRLKSSNLPLIE